MHIKIIFLGIGLLLNVAQAKPHFMQKLPPVVRYLASLEPNFASVPTAMRVYPHGMTITNKESRDWVLGAQNTSIEWIRKIISPEWLPADSNYLERSMIMVREKGFQRDIVYTAWESHGYSIVNMQTRTAFLLKIILPYQKHLQIKRETTLDVQELCNFVLNSDANIIIIAPNGNEIITKRHISDDFVKNCFDKSRVEIFEDGMHCQPRSIDANDEQNQNWDRWWRKLSWWTDGKSVGFYTVKVDGGAWVGSFDPEFDKHWFDGGIDLRIKKGHFSSPLEQEQQIPHRHGDMPPLKELPAP